MLKGLTEQNDAAKSSCFATYTGKWAVRRPTSRQCCRLGPAGPTKRFRDCRGSPRLSRLSPACARSTSRWPAWPEVDRKSLWMCREGKKTDVKLLFHCWYFAGPCEEKAHRWNVDYLDKLDSGQTRRPGTGRLAVRDPLTYNPVRRCTRACYWGCNRFPWSTPYWWIPEHRNLFFLHIKKSLGPFRRSVAQRNVNWIISKREIVREIGSFRNDFFEKNIMRMQKPSTYSGRYFFDGR